MCVCVYVCLTKSPKGLDEFGSGFRSKIGKHPRSVMECLDLFYYGAAVLRQGRVFKPGSRFSGIWLRMDVCIM